MKNKKSVNRILFLIGILISITLVYFSVVNVDLNKVIAEIRSSNYVYILPAVLIMFAGHWLRSIRWKMLLSPHQPIATRHLFSALMIGYLGNTVLPAHMGELIRSYIIKKKTGLPGSLVFGTIVLERFLDVLSLIIIMIVTLMVYPFPGWLYRSALAVTISIIVLLVLFTLFKAKGDVLLSIFSKSIGLFSERMAKIWSSKIKNFVQGTLPLNDFRDCATIVMLTLLIWTTYWLFLHLNLYAFDLVNAYKLTPISSLIVLIATTIGIIVPSSPGYVGTYHYLCILSLLLFDVPKDMALSYAIVAHAANIIPLGMVGLLFSWKEGIQLFRGQKYE